MGISRIFDMSRRSLAVYQRALDATTHNITNSANADYSRQQVNLSTEKSELTGGFVWGTGIKLDQISRVRNALTDTQLRLNQHQYSDNTQRSKVLLQIEGLYGEPSDLGLSSLMTGFFDSWSELAVTPNSIPLRQNVIRSGEKLAAKFGDINEGLGIIKSDVLNEAKAKVAALNNYLDQVQKLNAQIFESSAIGNNANDLMDKRDKVLDELSKLANLNISYDSTNTAIVSVGGVFGADRSNFNKFSLEEINGELTITGGNGIRTNLNGGELNGLKELYSTYIPEYSSKINLLVKSITESVNSEHQKGYTFENIPSAGGSFFEITTEGLLRINKDIKADPRKIAVSADGTSGNGEAAVRISELLNKKIIAGESFAENYASMISKMGSDSLSAAERAESSDLMLQQLQNQKLSYSGVSVDEEMTNIIKYQRSYDASAKLIKVADEILETILSLL